MTHVDRGLSFLFPTGNNPNSDNVSTNNRFAFPCNLSGRSSKLQAFGVLFCLVGSIAIALTVIEISHLSAAHSALAITGGLLFLCTGTFAIISSHKRFFSILLLVSLLSMGSTLFAVVWIMAFQVIIATSHDRLKSFGEELGPSFPYLLASQYLISGLGAVLGVLTAAFATTLLRETSRSSSRLVNERSNVHHFRAGAEHNLRQAREAIH